MEKSIELKKYKIAHSNFRKGLPDYNDGSSLNHNLGNDDYRFGNNEADTTLGNIPFDGSEANGNDLLEDDEYEEEDYYEEDQNRA